MGPPQIDPPPSAEEPVVPPRAAPNVEDADDIAIYDARNAELAAGGVVLPQRVSAAILHGDSRLKAIRHWRNETQKHLALKTGIAQGDLSDLETGRRPSTQETIAMLAQALDVSVEWLP